MSEDARGCVLAGDIYDGACVNLSGKSWGCVNI